MNRQEFFVELMSTLIGKQISLSDKIALTKAELEMNCAKVSDEIGSPLEVNMDEGTEPCPFYCSSIDKPFDFVWVGINPGGVLKAWKKLNFSWENTTWQELADFCVPTDDIRANEKNGYQFLKEDVESEYYKFFLRFHLALIDGEIFNNWTDLKERHADVEQLFIERVAKYSILNADLIPYKYRSISFKATKKLRNDANYENYFRRLIQFIEAETSPDAWIVFYGAPTEVGKLFKKFAPDWKVPKRKDFFRVVVPKKDGTDCQPRYFCTFTHGQRKIFLSPSLTGQCPSPIRNRLDVLIKDLKTFEQTVK